MNRSIPGLPVHHQLYPNPSPLSQSCHPTISSSVIPFSSCPQSFPALGSFQMRHSFASGAQSTVVSASASVLPMNIQDWFPFISVQFSRSVVSDSLWPHESQHARPPCPLPTLGVHSDSRPLNQWCHPAISSSVVPFSSCPQSLPASESFPMSQLFTWGGQSTGVSALASFLPKKSQGQSSSEWTGWISLQSKGLSESSATPQFKSINSLVLSFPHSPTLTSIHDHWKNHSLEEMDLCWQSNVSAFEYAI